MVALSSMLVFKIPFFPKRGDPKRVFLEGLKNDRKIFNFLFLSGTIENRIFCLKREDVGIMFPICITNDLLNMCFEPLVMALNVRAA